MNLLNEYKNMNSYDKKEFLELLKNDLSISENKYTFSELIDRLNKENVDIKLYSELIKHSDKIIKIANDLNELNKK